MSALLVSSKMKSLMTTLTISMRYSIALGVKRDATLVFPTAVQLVHELQASVRLVEVADDFLIFLEFEFTRCLIAERFQTHNLGVLLGLFARGWYKWKCMLKVPHTGARVI